MFSYKTAVALRKLGYSQIRIYNGGIKDWCKNALPIAFTDRLPDIQTSALSAEALLDKLTRLSGRCGPGTDRLPLVILDLRNEPVLSPGKRSVRIKSDCPTIHMLLDDLLKKEKRDLIPESALIVTVTETGNRDDFAIRYLSRFGITRIKRLRYGMRGWIKKRYPVE